MYEIKFYDLAERVATSFYSASSISRRSFRLHENSTKKRFKHLDVPIKHDILLFISEFFQDRLNFLLQYNAVRSSFHVRLINVCRLYRIFRINTAFLRPSAVESCCFRPEKTRDENTSVQFVTKTSGIERKKTCPSLSSYFRAHEK